MPLNLGPPSLGWEETTWVAMLYYCEQIQGGVSRSERQNRSCPVERSRSEEVTAERSVLMWVTCLPPGTMGISKLGLLPGAIACGLAAFMVCADVCVLLVLKHERIGLYRIGLFPTGCSTRENWPCPSLGNSEEQALPPHLGSTTELTLLSIV